jgi:hypothetical protein
MGTNELPIPFKIVKVEDKQFSVFQETLLMDAPIQQNIGFGFGVDPENRVIAVSMDFMLLKENIPLLKSEIICYFEIKEDTFDQLRQEKSVTLPSGFAKHLAVITTGTARGVLYANTKGSEFNKFILGLINIDKMFSENVDIPL